ncbi:hemicentin-1-like isoform X2 [Glandiceps talaboti]
MMFGVYVYHPLIYLQLIWAIFLSGTLCIEFISQPTSHITAELTPTWFHCSVRGAASVTYTWYFNIEPISGDNFHVYENGTLLIKQANQGNVGSYHCEVTSTTENIVSHEAVLTLAYIAESFSVNPTSHVKHIGDDVQLQCNIYSSPPPEIQWYFNGQPFSDGMVTLATTLSVLTVTPVQHHHMGVYTCVANNPLISNEERTSESAVVTVIGRPGFITTPSPETVPVGSVVEFQCESISIPTATVDWLDPHQNVIVDSERFHISLKKLTITSVIKSDEGYYTCRATNEWGENTALVLLTVEDSVIVTFTRRPSDQTVSIGSRVTFPCEASGNPNPVITWSKQSGRLPEDRVEEPAYGWLRIVDIQKEDEDIYTCTASNSQGFITATVQLNVQVGPSFIIEPSDQTVAADEEVTFQCEADGDPSPFMTWTTPNYGVYEVPSGERQGVIVNVNGSLHITSVQLEDAGVYTCTATNVVTTVYSSVTLQVLSKPKFVQTQENLRVVEGDSPYLHCQASGNPTPLMTWYFNGVQLMTSPRQDVYSTGDVQLHNIEKNQEGVYVCKGENSLGFIQHAVFVIILVPPKFTLHPSDTIVEIGSHVTLSCAADGFPAPTLQWTKDGQPLAFDMNVIVFSNYTILISSILTSNLGSYTCIASNEAGINQVTGSLLTRDIPVFTVQPSNVTANLSYPISLPCQAMAREPPTITWYISDFDGSKIYPVGDGNTPSDFPGANSYISTSGHLYIWNVRLIDQTWYVCEAANSVGVITTNLYLSINQPPNIYSSPSVLATENNHAILHCHSSGKPTPTITWHGPHGEQLQQQTYYVFYSNSLVISPVSVVRDTGNYSCIATNLLGQDEATVPLTVQGKPVLVGVDIKHDFNKTTIECKSIGSPQPITQWLLNGIQVDTSNTIPGHFVTPNYQLIIYDDVSMDASVYNCWSTNKFGDSLDSYTLTVPMMPSSPAVQNITASTVDITWSDIPTAEPLLTLLYNLEVDENNEGFFEVLASDIRDSYYTVDKLKPYTSYSFRVQAVNELGAGKFSMSSNIITKQSAPTKPLDVIAKVTVDYILLQWSQPEPLNGKPEAVQYEIIYHDVNSSTTRQVFVNYHPGALQIELIDAIYSHHYNISIRAVNVDVHESSDYITVISKMVDPAPVNMVEGLKVIPTDTDAVLLSWQVGDLKDIDGYIVAYRQSNESSYTVIELQIVSIDSYKLNGLQKNTKYWIKMAYSNSGGVGPYTSEILVKTLLDLLDPEEMNRTSNDDDTIITPGILGAIVGVMLALAMLLLVLAICLCHKQRSTHGLRKARKDKLWITTGNLYDETGSLSTGGLSGSQGHDNITFSSNENYHPDSSYDTSTNSTQLSYEAQLGQRSKKGRLNFRAKSSDMYNNTPATNVVLMRQSNTLDDDRQDGADDVQRTVGGRTHTTDIKHVYEDVDSTPSRGEMKRGDSAEHIYAKVNNEAKINSKIKQEQERLKKIGKKAEEDRHRAIEKAKKNIEKERKSDKKHGKVQEMQQRSRENAAMY